VVISKHIEDIWAIGMVFLALGMLLYAVISVAQAPQDDDK
jgi:hypothetical protein